MNEQLGVVAHELRNSLGALRMGLHLMQTKRGAPIAAAKARTVVERQVEQMSRLIDDLMPVSLTRSGVLRLQCECIDLGVVVTSAIASFEPEIARRRQRLIVNQPGTPIWLNADPGRLQQVIMNLLANAAKFTEDGGELRLTVERDATSVSVCVADTGIGIASHELPHVFDSFPAGELAAAALRRQAWASACWRSSVVWSNCTVATRAQPVAVWGKAASSRFSCPRQSRSARMPFGETIE